MVGFELIHKDEIFFGSAKVSAIPRNVWHILLAFEIIVWSFGFYIVFRPISQPSLTMSSSENLLLINDCYVRLTRTNSSACAGEKAGYQSGYVKALRPNQTIVSIDGKYTFRCSYEVCLTPRSGLPLTVKLRNSIVNLNEIGDGAGMVDFPISIETDNAQDPLTVGKVYVGSHHFSDLFVNISKGIVVLSDVSADHAAIHVSWGTVILNSRFISSFQVTADVENSNWCLTPRVAMIASPCVTVVGFNGTTTDRCPLYASFSAPDQHRSHT